VWATAVFDQLDVARLGAGVLGAVALRNRGGEVAGGTERLDDAGGGGGVDGEAGGLGFAKVDDGGTGAVAEGDQFGGVAERGDEVIGTVALGGDGGGELDVRGVGDIKDGEERSLLLLDVEVGGAVCGGAEQQVLAGVGGQRRLAGEGPDDQLGLDKGRCGKSAASKYKFLLLISFERTWKQAAQCGERRSSARACGLSARIT
jgi:hypothetical protein